MSNREKCNLLLDSFDETQLVSIIAMLQAAKGLAETEDDAYCARLYQNYLDDPDKDEMFTLEDCKKEWDIA